MAYTPENNPYTPGDPYSYDLKWIVDRINSYDWVEKYAEEAKVSAGESAASAAASAESATDSAASELNANQSANSAAQSASLIGGTAADLRVEMRALGARMDKFEQLTPGSTTGDAELQDIRITWDGKTKATAGDAVRTQASNLADNIIKNNSYNLLPIFANFSNSTTQGVTAVWNNDIVTLNGTATANGAFIQYLGTNGIPAPLRINESYILRVTNYDPTDNARVSIVILRSSGNITYYLNSVTKEISFTIPSDCTGITFRIFISNGGIFNNTNIRYELLSAHALKDITQKSRNVFEQYAQLEPIPGTWTSGLTLNLTSNAYHTGKLEVRPNTTYYTTNNPEAYFSIFAAQYDEYGTFCGLIYTSQLEEIIYQTADGTGTFTDYGKIWKFTTHEKARYISINHLNQYRQGIASKPIYLTYGLDNIIITEDDPIYSKTKDKKLCIIGTSAVMIDRLGRTGEQAEPFPTPQSQFIAGFQEHLIPWYKNVTSFGYSNGTFINSPTPSNNNIYQQITAKDLSSYDEFLLCLSSIGVTADTVGNLTNPDDLGDQYTYMGSVRRLIDYIYSQNGRAKIYLLTRFNRPAFTSESYYNNQLITNAATRKIGELCNLQVIDAARESGYNSYNTNIWCYDNLGHLNQYGNKMFAEFVRKQMIGI